MKYILILLMMISVGCSDIASSVSGYNTDKDKEINSVLGMKPDSTKKWSYEEYHYCEMFYPTIHLWVRNTDAVPFKKVAGVYYGAEGIAGENIIIDKDCSSSGNKINPKTYDRIDSVVKTIPSGATHPHKSGVYYDGANGSPLVITDSTISYSTNWRE